MPLRVVVIGGGIAGVSAAYHVASTGAQVVLIEQEAALAFHSTGRSAALYFENYGAQPNRALTRASRGFFDDPPAGLIDHELLGKRGALWVGRPDQVETLEAIFEEGTGPGGVSAGGSSRWLDPGEAVKLVPVLRPELVAGAVLEPEALDLDVAALHQGFVRGLRAAGATILTSCRATGLNRRGNQWLVATSDHELTADVIVNAAGAWCDQIGALAGAAPIGLRPLRRTAFTVPGNDAWAGWPLVSNADNEFYFRPDGSQLLCSLAEENPTDPGDARPDQLDIARAIDRINAHTTIGIRAVRSAWTGLRSFVADRAMVIGFDPLLPGFFWLAGQGGTGIQTAPAAGELTASLITRGESPARIVELGLNVDDLSPARLQSSQIV